MPKEVFILKLFGSLVGELPSSSGPNRGDILFFLLSTAKKHWTLYINQM